MSELKICDYSDFDYKTEFWVKANRQYEHELEKHMVNRLLRQNSNCFKSILDAGCGFGRMVPSYQKEFEQCYLVDYAKNLLDQAQKELRPKEQFSYFQQSLYELDIETTVDAIISIRTLHHLNNIDELFERYYKTLNPDGTLIIDVPNYYHLKSRMKSPFQERRPMIKLSETFYNYDPYYIIEKLKQRGFNVIDYRQLGLFRINLIKQIIPHQILVRFETFLNRFIKNIHIGPSVYIVAKKCG